MIRKFIGLCVLITSSATAGASADWPYCGQAEVFPGKKWSAGGTTHNSWSDLSAVEAMFTQLESESLMVVHRGHPVLSLGAVAQPRMLASLRKSVLSSLFGAWDQANALDLDQTLEQLGINETDPPLSAGESEARIRDLLMARSGIFRSAHYEIGGWKREKDNARQWSISTRGVPHQPPGQLWLYNNWDFNVLASIYEKVSGEGIYESFANRVAGPLGMEDFGPDDVTFVGNESYAERRMGNFSDHPAYMFHMSTRDLARLGLLYLNCGQWNGQAVIDRNWVLSSTEGVPIARGAPAESRVHTFYGDYGWQWWVDKPGQRRTFWKMEIDGPVYFGQGYRGHYLWVAPYLDLVVAHQVATKGGLDIVSQLRRRFLGSPEISDVQFQQLLTLIIAAHPEKKPMAK